MSMYTVTSSFISHPAPKLRSGHDGHLPIAFRLFRSGIVAFSQKPNTRYETIEIYGKGKGCNQVLLFNQSFLPIVYLSSPPLSAEFGGTPSHPRRAQAAAQPEPAYQRTPCNEQRSSRKALVSSP